MEEGGDPGDNGVTETKKLEGGFCALKRDALKCFAEVQLKHEAGYVVLFGIVKHVKGVAGVVANVPIRQIGLLPAFDQSF